MCFLVVSVLLLPELVLFKLLFLVLSLCLYGEDVARGWLSGSRCSQKWRCLTELESCFLDLWYNLRRKKTGKLSCGATLAANP